MYLLISYLFPFPFLKFLWFLILSFKISCGGCVTSDYGDDNIIIIIVIKKYCYNLIFEFFNIYIYIIRNKKNDWIENWVKTT
jgi:hypothetical protein